MVGTTLHHYRIIEALGSGGMGEVYAAEDTRLKRRVALKVLPRIVANDVERRGRFEREAQAIAALNHPNIVLAPLIDQRNRFSPFERTMVDYFDAAVQGRQTEALADILEAEKLSPRDWVINYMVGNALVKLNRPAEVLATYKKLPNPDWVTRVAAGGWQLSVSARARHLLGDFEGELRDAREAQRVAPQSSINYRGVEARALIGLGKITDALRVVDDSLALPGSAGEMMLTVVRELQAHGQRQALLDLALRTVTWYRNRPPDVASTETTRAGLGRALYAAEQWDDAEDVFRALARQVSANVEDAGYLGALAARRGDRADAAKRSDALRSIQRPYLFGSHTMWRARIAAQLHEEAAAVDLLRDAFAQGASFTIETHRDVDLEPLANNAAFRELMRPKE